MAIIEQFKTKGNKKLIASAVVSDLDSARMIRRLCKHFSHKIDAGWNNSNGYIEFHTGFCEMSIAGRQLNLRCGADSEVELTELVDCIDSHFSRFDKETEQSIKWSITNFNDKS